MPSTSSIIESLKSSGEDYEWYPTDKPIVNVCRPYLESCHKILDIGCGKGDFFEKLNLDHITKYGIEKSTPLLNLLPDDIILLGTDFNEQSLVDKQVDAIFCNPPYSEYEAWASRILKEGNAETVILVIPERWKDSPIIKETLKLRKYKIKNLGTFNFENAERKARAVVNAVVFTRSRYEGDAFDLWWAQTFPFKEAQRTDENPANTFNTELIQGENVAEQLVSLYQRDTDNLFHNYKALSDLDPELLKSMNVNVENLKTAMKEKIAGLKQKYWNELFNRYGEITRRLTSTSRDRFLGKLHNNASIDFTMGNIYAVTLWIIRNSNSMYDEQLKTYYLQLADTDSIRQYKSNKRFSEDDWRYLKGNLWRKELVKNICYEYRIVYKKISSNYSYSHLSDSSFDFIWDTIHIAENLGFKFSPDVFYPRQWDTPQVTQLDLNYADGTPFVNLKLYQNGNIHLRFDPEFMRRLNVEAARLFGWITERSEAVEELGVTEAEAARAWGRNTKVIAARGVLGIEFKE